MHEESSRWWHWLLRGGPTPFCHWGLILLLVALLVLCHNRKLIESLLNPRECPFIPSLLKFFKCEEFCITGSKPKHFFKKHVYCGLTPMLSFLVNRIPNALDNTMGSGLLTTLDFALILEFGLT